MKVVKGLASYIVDGKEVMIVSSDWKGSPIIAHKPDILIIKSEALNKFSKNVLFLQEIKAVEI